MLDSQGNKIFASSQNNYLSLREVNDVMFAYEKRLPMSQNNYLS